MLDYLWLAAGGAIGTAGRFWLSSTIAGRWGETFPLGTLFVNVTGSFLIGLFEGLTRPESRLAASPVLRQFFMIGVCGGYTTFSSFSLQTLNLAQDGEWLWAGLNILVSVALCLIGVWLGHILGVMLSHK